MSAILPHSDGSEISQQSSTLPRRHRRHMSSESTFMIWSRDCSPIRRHSPHYSSGSLPRSIHSGHSKMRLQSRSPAQESARAQQRHQLDEKISQEREKHFRSMQLSGPSSLESGKTSVMSGPSSIDSGKNSSSRTTSCMSSLESNGPPSIRSVRRLTGGGATSSTSSPLDQYNLPSIIANSMSNNSITLQVTTTTSNNNCSSNNSNGGGNAGNHVNHHQQYQSSNGRASAPAGPQAARHSHGGNRYSQAESASSGSSNCSNSTKIFVQNSPARSVIKLENGKLSENANVVIINKNETIAGNNHKEVIQFNALPTVKTRNHQQKPLETQFDHLNGDCYVVFRGDRSADNPDESEGGVFFSGDPQRQRQSHPHQQNRGVGVEDPIVINNKLNNQEDPSNSASHRKLSLQTSHSSSSVGGHNLIYKNLLRQNSDRQPEKATTTTTLNKADEPDYFYAPREAGSLNNQVSGSVGCLGAAGSAGFLSKLKSLNSIDSLATIYQKSNSLMTVGSEPNLVELKVGGGEKFNNQKHDKLNNMVPRKETNLTKSELDPAITGSEDMYDFPSLTDLSFNSLAALKILQEMKLNSDKMKSTICP